MKLPLNCTVDYLEDFLSKSEADALYNLLIEEYEIHKARIIIDAGGVITETDGFKILFLTEELKAQNSHPEEIHGKSYIWTGIMKELRDRVESYTGKEFELAMCLYYPNGNFFAPYHSDQDTSGVKTVLPSISLGEVREFAFRPKEEGASFSLDLAHGSMLLMADYCQQRYEHSLLMDEKKYPNGRINITFREPTFQ